MHSENDDNEKKYVTKEELATLRRSIMAVIELLNDQMAELEEELQIANRSSLEQVLGVVVRRRQPQTPRR